MPVIPPGSLVLVTGASGFVAVHVVKTLLDAGFPVRGTVRTAAKGEYLQNLFKDSPVPFAYIVVANIETASRCPGAFDAAVMDVVGVAHTASPFHWHADDPSELIGPAVHGTLGLLNSIQRINPQVKRVVVTSSCAAIINDNVTKPHCFTEADWNTTSVHECETLGRNASATAKYRASKTLAEKALWQFIEVEQPHWDGVTINPSMVWGPLLQQAATIKDINESTVIIHEWFTGNKPQSDIPSVAPFNGVDVRDVALAHLRALIVPEAGSERFILSNAPASPNDFVLAFEHYWPERTTYPRGDASKVETINAGSNYYDHTKSERVLGIQYTSFDESIKDATASLIARYGI
ncbi:methylglyoxal reductase (NADPH-dependent) gre2 [Apiotrichum porosum]|uniref:Methylglyoxal reductase (NADPH-dependent) gre2 n=1 Tax=Apiotrichum porosum TaxID=105984 RepID=A0A427XXJ6_9TREE|nr:methylglyoxal reductase (NADPH-dependent) gre2 [Apiotrichum porosum]RSH83542.1 methylglyoxal reductase (NADPH-dependent) gre2 [Apiotrichum porosum]